LISLTEPAQAGVFLLLLLLLSSSAAMPVDAAGSSLAWCTRQQRVRFGEVNK
jgi:hypothetical protein